MQAVGVAGWPFTYGVCIHFFLKEPLIENGGGGGWVINGSWSKRGGGCKSASGWLLSEAGLPLDWREQRDSDGGLLSPHAVLAFVRVPLLSFRASSPSVLVVNKVVCQKT